MKSGNSSLVPLKREGDGPTLYLVHPAGGHVVCYRNLARFIKRPLYAFQNPSLSFNVALITSIVELASFYIRDLKSAQKSGPYFLGAWSTGSYIAFEMARQLMDSGDEVAKLIVLDSPSPHDSEPVAEHQTLTWFLEDRAPTIKCENMKALSFTDCDESNLQLALQQLPGDDREFLDAGSLLTNYQVFRAMIKAGRAYQPQAVELDISICQAREQIVEEFFNHPCRDMKHWGWELLTSKAVDKKIVSGSHYSFLSDSHVWETAVYINRHTQLLKERRWNLA